MKNIILKIFSIFIFSMFFSICASAANNNGTSIDQISNDGFVEPSISSSQTAYVSSDTEFTSALSKSNIKKIVLTADISYPYRSISFKTRNVGDSNFVIDGNGHTANFQNMRINLNNVSNIIVENLKMVNGDWFGPIYPASGSSKINYRNITFWGQQLLESSSSNVNFYGNIGIHSVNRTSSYGSLYSAHEENVVANDLNINQNCNFFSETYGGNALVVGGDMNIGSGADVTVKPHIWSTVNSSGIWLSRSSDSLNVGDNASLNVIADNSSITMDDGTSESKNANINSSKSSNAIYSPGNTNINIGNNSLINVQGNGNVYNTNTIPLLNLGTLDLKMADSSSFIAKTNASKNLSNGILNISNNSVVNASNSSTFDLSSNSDQTSGSSLLIDASKFTINADSPKLINLDNTGDKSKDKKLVNSSSNFITASNVFTSISGFDKNKNSLSIDNTPFSNIVLPINNSDSKLITEGSYSNVKNLYDYLNNVKSNATNKIKMTQLTDPVLDVDNTTANDATNTITGTVKDKNGNLLKDSYVKIYANKDNTDNYYFNPFSSSPTQNDILDFLNMDTLLYSDNKTDLNDNSFSGISDTSIFNNKMFTDTQGYFQKYTDSNVLGNSKLVNTSDVYNSKNPYVTKTDSNGKFSFTIPNAIWNEINDQIIKLNVISTFNMHKSNIKQVTLNQPTQITYGTLMKNVSKGGGFKSKLTNVDQGNSSKTGDVLEYGNTIKNTSSHINYKNISLSLPVPKSINTDQGIQLSYDNGKTYTSLKSSDYELTNDSNDALKLLKINKIETIKPGEKIILRVKFTLQNKNNSSDDTVSFTPTLSVNNTSDDIPGTKMSIGFGGSVTIAPEDLYYDVSRGVNDGIELQSTNPTNLAAKIEDRRQIKTDGTVMVRQNNKGFVSSDGKTSFDGTMYYKNNDYFSNLYNNDVTIKSGKLDNIYWNKDSQIVLIPDENFSNIGEYNNGDKTTDKNGVDRGPGLTWTVKFGY